MEIITSKNGNSLILKPQGRLDTLSAPAFEKVFQENKDGVEDLTIDLSELVYLSSAGLRVLLAAQKTMNRQGKMTVRHANSDVLDVFEITGFSELLHIEQDAI